MTGFGVKTGLQGSATSVKSKERSSRTLGEREKRRYVLEARFPPGADIAHQTDGRFNRIKSHPLRMACKPKVSVHAQNMI